MKNNRFLTCVQHSSTEVFEGPPTMLRGSGLRTQVSGLRVSDTRFEVQTRAEPRNLKQAEAQQGVEDMGGPVNSSGLKLPSP